MHNPAYQASKLTAYTTITTNIHPIYLEGARGSAILLPFLSSPRGRALEWCSVMSQSPLMSRVYVNEKRAEINVRSDGGAVAGYAKS
jgi:hypothetical protein